MERCPDCPRTHDPIAGHGPRDAEVVCIGEAPGKDEVKGSIPFIGKAGREFNEHYLPLASLSRSEVFVCNSVSCFWATSGDAPPPKLIESCSNFHVRRYLEEINPRIVVTMGGVATSLIQPRVELDLQHGIPITASICGWRGPVMPVWHPALGLHKTSRIRDTREDFRSLKSWLSGTLTIPRDRYPNAVREEIADSAILEWLLEGDTIAIDTELAPSGPWCLTFATRGAEGYMLRPGHDPDLLRRFAAAIENKTVVMHNSLFDVAVLRRMGVHVRWDQVRDTMMMAYHRGLPIGLKTLAYRLLGMKMKSYEDLVMPYSTMRALDYLLGATCHDWPKPDKVMENGKWKQPHGMSTKLKRLFTDADKGEVDVFKRWDNWGDQERYMLETKLGKFPKPSIEYAPFDEALEYATNDARATIQLLPIIEERGVRWG